jgi:hypothetical protein
MLNSNPADSQPRFSWLTLAFALGFFSCVAFGQSTVSTGSITGTVTDVIGAVLAGATVTMTGPQPSPILPPEVWVLRMISDRHALEDVPLVASAPPSGRCCSLSRLAAPSTTLCN